MTTDKKSLLPTPNPAGEHDRMLGKFLPELSVVATLLWFLFWPSNLLKPSHEYLLLTAIIDASTLMISATLVDIASRLKRQLPGWWLLAIALGVLLLNPYLIFMLKMAWAMDLWIFLPFVWALLERMRELWTLPSASVIEKLRRRTLTFDRLYTALIMGFFCVAAGIVNALQNQGSMTQDFSQQALPWVMLAFYCVAALNVWRVHQPRFAKCPRSLWPWIDGDQVNYLNPL